MQLLKVSRKACKVSFEFSYVSFFEISRALSFCSLKFGFVTVQYFEVGASSIEKKNSPTISWTGFFRENYIYFWLYTKDPFGNNHFQISIYTGGGEYLIYKTGEVPSGLSGVSLLGKFFACSDHWCV